MDSIIPIGQKNTLAEHMILSSADNHPPMLDKDLYDSWKSIMELYMQNRENGRMILELVEHGPLIWHTIEENRGDQDKEICLPSDIYSLVNHHRVAKDLWEKGRQNTYAAGTSGTRANTSGTGGNYSGQQRVVKCFNCQGEVIWQYSAQSQRGKGMLHDPGIAEGPVTQSVSTHNIAYQADDLDLYEFDCDEISTAKAVP
ncbi:hypothetical protein Tco_0808291, partial [Tanacetum coccineum]